MPLTGLTWFPPYFCVCPKSVPEFPMSYFVDFFCVFNMSSVKMRGDCFVDIGGIDDKLLLNFFS